MRKTYAYNSITIGVLVGLLVGLSTDNVVLAVLAALGVSVVGFIVIRLIENAISAGVDKVADKATDAYRKHKEQKMMQNGGYTQPNTTRMPNTTQMPQRTTFPQQAAPQQRTTFPQQGAAQQTTFPVQAPVQTQPAEALVTCPYCGAKIRATAQFCPSCGGAMKH